MRDKAKIIFAVSALFIAAMLLFYEGSAVNSSGGNFTVTPDNVSLNWTGAAFASVNITTSVNDTFFNIFNTTTTIAPQYFSLDKYSLNEYAGYDFPNYSICFENGMKFAVQNSSGTYTNVTKTLLFDQTNSTRHNLTAYQFCPPGYYFGKFNVTQNGTADWASVSAAVNIPIHEQNTFEEPNNTAYLKGTLAANGNVIHKYYFNTSLAQNLTAVTINLSDYSQDVDFYLIDSAETLLAKSTENGSAREEININLPSTPDIWQLWIWGNVSVSQNYIANMYFSTLNVTNTSNRSQQMTSLNFGSLVPAANLSSQVNITIENMDSTIWPGVGERSEIYRVETSNLRNTSGDYYFIVPSYATKVKAKIEWKGGTRWTVSLNDSAASFLGNSSAKYMAGNLTGTVQEESVLYNGTISESNDGLWKLTVNASAINGNDYYNITVFVWQSSAGWISSTFPASGFTLNSSPNANSSINVSLQLLLQTPNIMNGTYQGFLDYYYPSGWNKRIPVYFNVLAGGLLFNNTLNSYTVSLNDNIGFNRLGAGVLQITLPFNNTGGQPIYFVNTTSGANLSLSTHNMSFAVGWPSNPIDAGSSGNITVNVSINTSLTGDTSGVYSGWILLNTTNSTNASSSSLPFNTFNITVNVNLSQYLTVNVTDIFPSFVPNNTIINNITANITVKLANGTVISSISQLLNQSNFYDVYLNESNTSYGSTTLTPLNNLTNSTIGAPWNVVCPGGSFNNCRLNGLLPANIIGGVYYLVASASFNTSLAGGNGLIIGGTGSGKVQTVVNQTAVYVQGTTDAGNVFEGSSTTYTAYINNYGPLAATDLQVRFDKGSCSPLTISRYVSNCSGAVSGSTAATDWKLTLSGYAPVCTLSWTLLSTYVDSETNCDDMAVRIMTNHPNYGNITGIMLTVFNNGTSGQQQGQQQQTACVSNATCASTQYCVGGSCVTLTCPSGMTASNHVCVRNAGKLEITNYTANVYVLQGGSNSTKVTVKNTGGYTYTAKLEVASAFEGFTANTSPASYSLGSGNAGIFTLNFSVSASAEIGYHAITLKAYANENSSVYETKNVTIAVEPLEETKAVINRTSEDLKSLFVSVTGLFNQMPPGTDANYTLANRTYTRILNMFQDVENSIKAGRYLEASSLLKELNASLAEFKQQVSQLSGGGGIFPSFGDFGGTLTLVAIFVVILVIGGFLAYLLLPSKKTGFHPALGYMPAGKVTTTGGLVRKIKDMLSKIKRPRIGGGGQKTLGQFEKPATPVAAAPPQKPAEKKTYMEGYHRLDQFPLSYDKSKFKEKK